MSSDVLQQSQETYSPNPAHLKIASRDKRVYNVFLDGILISIILYIFYNYAFAGLPGELWPPLYKNVFSNFLIVFIYYFVFELVYHKTPGKFLTKTKVIEKDGSPLTFKHILIRSLVRLIPFEWVSFYFNQHPIGWHDKFSNTIVIDESASRSNSKNLETANKIAKVILYVLIALLVLLLLFLGPVALNKVIILFQKAAMR